MSHIVQIRTEVRDLTAVQSACRRLGLAAATQGTVELFSGQATGVLVPLPGWRYPAVFDTATGEVRYDNYDGRWGAQQELDRFLQAYAVEKARLEARKQGHTVSERPLEDGSLHLTIHVGGAA